MRNYLIDHGATFLYNSLMTDILIDNKQIKGIEINNKEEILCDYLILAIGHSARDTFKLLNERGIIMQSKPFAVGLRIEHPQNLINGFLFLSRYRPVSFQSPLWLWAVCLLTKLYH